MHDDYRPIGNRALIEYKHEIVKARPSGVLVYEDTPGNCSGKMVEVVLTFVPEKARHPLKETAYTYYNKDGDLTRIKSGDTIIVERGALMLNEPIGSKTYPLSIIDIIAVVED